MRVIFPLFPWCATRTLRSSRFRHFFASIRSKYAKKLRPFCRLARVRGFFCGQLLSLTKCISTASRRIWLSYSFLWYGSFVGDVCVLAYHAWLISVRPCHAITIRTGVDVTFLSIRNDKGRSLGRNIIPAFPFRLRVTDRKFKEMTLFKYKINMFNELECSPIIMIRFVRLLLARFETNNIFFKNQVASRKILFL